MDNQNKTLELFEVLRIWRNETAQQQGKKPFMVFNNDTLLQTAKIQPKTKEELIEIKGWGEKKIKQYGDDILTLINHPNQLKPEKSVGDVLSVGECLNLINKTFFQHIGAIKIQGEISESSGREKYAFFQLKDSSGQDYLVQCFLGWRNYELFKHLLEVGLEVQILGYPQVYKNGRFHIEVEKMEPVGAGAFKKAFEALKKKLIAKGWFDLARKRPMPEFIQKIGLITSGAGAAINDFRKNLGNYGFQIYLKDVFVEGDRAETSIVSAIQWFNKNQPDLDVLVLIRGGGSLENLKAFNSEAVAEAIVLSRLPMITGIGHEKDESIADFVADKSFATPSLVSVFIKNQREELISQLELHTDSLISFLEAIFKHKQLIISRLAEQMSSGLNRIFASFKILEQKFLKIIYQHESAVQKWSHHLDLLVQKGFNILQTQYHQQQKRLAVASTALASLNPEAILKRGYSLTYDQKMKLIKEVKNIKVGDTLLTKLAKGKIISKVKNIKN